MRMMLRWQIPVEKGNAVIAEGAHAAALEAFVEELGAEAAYFWTEDGKRAGLVVFDMADSSRIAEIAEPLFMSTDAEVSFTPVMNLAELKTGLAKAAAKG